MSLLNIFIQSGKNINSGTTSGETSRRYFCTVVLGSMTCKTAVKEDSNGNPLWNESLALPFNEIAENFVIKIYENNRKIGHLSLSLRNAQVVETDCLNFENIVPDRKLPKATGLVRFRYWVSSSNVEKTKFSRSPRSIRKKSLSIIKEEAKVPVVILLEPSVVPGDEPVTLVIGGRHLGMCFEDVRSVEVMGIPCEESLTYESPYKIMVKTPPNLASHSLEGDVTVHTESGGRGDCLARLRVESTTLTENSRVISQVISKWKSSSLRHQRSMSEIKSCKPEVDLLDSEVFVEAGETAEIGGEKSNYTISHPEEASEDETAELGALTREHEVLVRENEDLKQLYEDLQNKYNKLIFYVSEKPPNQ